MLIPLTDWPHNWPTVSALRRYRDKSQADPRTRDGRVYAPFRRAFVKIGRRVLVDEEAFWGILREQGDSLDAPPLVD